MVEFDFGQAFTVQSLLSTKRVNKDIGLQLYLDGGSRPPFSTVPGATVRMTDVLHEMVVRIYTPQIEGGLNNNSSRRKK